MKLAVFKQAGKQALGIKTEQGMLDVAAAQATFPEHRVSAETVMDVISGGEAVLAQLEALQRKVLESGDDSCFLKEDDLEWEPCVTHPGKIICVGLNYKKHADETKAPYPETPILFNKFNNTLTGHNRNVAIPAVTEKLDYEAELAIVIGKQARNVAKTDALDYVFGYCNANDLSARDLQLRTQQWLLGKTCDGFCPLGPYLVTADEAGDPNQLQISTVVNGEVRQQSNTADMIFYCDDIVSYISKHMTLEPGDVILTGTPEGVILGYPKEQRVWLKPGDVVTVEIEKLGKLTNRFVQ